MADDEQFEQTSSGASATIPKQCSSLRKSDHVMIKSRPCKIVEMSTSKTGKHGHAKVHLVAIDLFTGKKLEDICPSTHNMECPNVTRQDFTLMDVTDEDFLSLMSDNGDVREDLKLPDDGEVRQMIKNRWDNGEDTMVTVLAACGEESVIAAKPSTK